MAIKNMKKKKITIIGLLIVVLTLMATGCGSSKDEKKPAESQQTEQVDNNEAIDDTTVNESISEDTENSDDDFVAEDVEEAKAKEEDETLSADEIADIMGYKDLREVIMTDMFTAFDVVDAWAVENGYRSNDDFYFTNNAEGIEIPFSKYTLDIDDPTMALVMYILYDYPNNQFIIKYAVIDEGGEHTYKYTTDEIPNAEQAIEEALEMHANR